MYKNISYTAAYAEMTRYVLQGIEAAQRRETALAIRAFEHASQLAATSNLGPEAIAGSNRNLAGAYRVAGMLTDAERVLRELLDRPDLIEAERPFILHELGAILSQVGGPEAADLLNKALSLYEERQDILLCALDLAEYQLNRADYDSGYALLSAQTLPEDATDYPECFCHAHLTMARCALAQGQVDRATSHLETAHAVLSITNGSILHALYLAVQAEREYAEGEQAAAEAHAITALESGMTESEAETGEVLRTIATIFLKIADGRAM